MFVCMLLLTSESGFETTKLNSYVIVTTLFHGLYTQSCVHIRFNGNFPSIHILF